MSDLAADPHNVQKLTCSAGLAGILAALRGAGRFYICDVFNLRAGRVTDKEVPFGSQIFGCNRLVVVCAAGAELRVQLSV